MGHLPIDYAGTSVHAAGYDGDRGSVVARLVCPEYPFCGLMMLQTEDGDTSVSVELFEQAVDGNPMHDCMKVVLTTRSVEIPIVRELIMTRDELRTLVRLLHLYTGV